VGICGWIRLAQHRDKLCAVVDTTMNFRVALKEGSFLTI